MKSLLLELLHYFLEHAGFETSALESSLTHEKLETVLQYMEENLSEPLDLTVLAKLVHLHPNYFSQLFKNMLGVSPMYFLKRMRMDKAKVLLEQTTLPITEIATLVGIEPHYFSRIFKEQESFTPSDYRNRSLFQ